MSFSNSCLCRISTLEEDESKRYPSDACRVWGMSVSHPAPNEALYASEVSSEVTGIYPFRPIFYLLLRWLGTTRHTASSGT